MDLVGSFSKVNPITNSNLTNTELYNLITPEKQGTKFTFNIMRIFPQGEVKIQTHPEQHAVFVLRGNCRILLNDKWVDVKEEDYVYIPPNMTHSFLNVGDVLTDVLILKL